MTYTSDGSPSAPAYIRGGRRALAPLHALDFVLQQVIAANRLARDFETVSRLSDANLAERGLDRESIGPYFARKSGLL